MSDAPAGRKLTIMLVPDGGRETRTLTLSYRVLRVLAASGVIVALLLTVMAGSWWYLAARAARAGQLQQEVEVMTSDRARVAALVQRLETIEGQYGAIRTLFGQAQAEQPSGVWLPPVAAPRRGDAGAERPQVGPTRPSFWPLTERGFVTQELHDRTEVLHPGLDIAVASDSYIRAAGGGTVIDVGEDAVYGRFVGEGSHHSHFDATEFGIHVLFGGHYATETFGVRALGNHVADRFGLLVTHIDQPTGL